MAKTPQNYPLQWPAHRPRKTPGQRRPGPFKTGRDPISLVPAVDRLETQLRLLGGKSVVLSTNVEPRLDGRPRAGQSAPSDPGVCAYFTLRGKPIAFACDAFTTVAQNIAALAAHIESVRGQERWGVASAEESLQAFSALPNYATGAPTTRPWRDVLGFQPEFPTGLDREDAEALIQSRWKKGVAALGGPDGGKADEVADFNVARDQALAELEAEG